MNLPHLTGEHSVIPVLACRMRPRTGLRSDRSLQRSLGIISCDSVAWVSSYKTSSRKVAAKVRVWNLIAALDVLNPGARDYLDSSHGVSFLRRKTIRCGSGVEFDCMHSSGGMRRGLRLKKQRTILFSGLVTPGS